MMRWLAVLVIAVVASFVVGAVLVSSGRVTDLEDFASKGRRHTQEERLQDIRDAVKARDLIRQEMRDQHAAMERESRTADAVILEQITKMQEQMRAHGCGEFTHFPEGEEP